MHFTSSSGAWGLFPSDVTKSETCWFPKDMISLSWDAPHTLQAVIVETWISGMSVSAVATLGILLVFVVESGLFADALQLQMRLDVRSEVPIGRRALSEIEQEHLVLSGERILAFAYCFNIIPEMGFVESFGSTSDFLGRPFWIFDRLGNRIGRFSKVSIGIAYLEFVN